MLNSIAIILLSGMGLGFVFQKSKLPALLGMIVAGILIGPYALDVLDQNTLRIAPDIRQIALVIILTRAGLSLSFQDVREVGRPAFFMSFLPACFEVAAIAILGHYLFDLNFIDACLMGCVLAAVSPAIIVPSMLKMMKEGYGTNKKVPQLILAGASLDDIFMIILFSSFLSLAQGAQINMLLFLRIPISIVLGGIVGFVCARSLLVMFSKGIQSTLTRVLSMFIVSFALLALQNELDGIISISALVGIMMMAMTIKKQNEKISSSLLSVYSSLWEVAKIFLFVLVGACVNIASIEEAGIKGVILIVVALLVRMIGVYSCLFKTNLTSKEKIFCMGAYTPKATVQAAIGAIPLSMGLASGQLILTIAVMSILISAPIGSIFIDKSYRHLLTKK